MPIPTTFAWLCMSISIHFFISIVTHHTHQTIPLSLFSHSKLSSYPLTHFIFHSHASSLYTTCHLKPAFFTHHLSSILMHAWHHHPPHSPNLQPSTHPVPYPYQPLTQPSKTTFKPCAISEAACIRSIISLRARKSKRGER